MSDLKTPKHLRADGRAYWQAVTAQFVLEAFHLPILQTAAEALDRAAEARAAIEAQGLVIVPTEGGMARANPAAKIERDSWAMFLRAQGELGLTTEDPPAMGRPPKGY